MAIYGKALRDQRRIDERWAKLTPAQKAQINHEKEERRSYNESLKAEILTQYAANLAAGMDAAAAAAIAIERASLEYK